MQCFAMDIPDTQSKADLQSPDYNNHILYTKALPHGTTLSEIRATVLLANRPRASTRTETIQSLLKPYTLLLLLTL